MTEKIGYFISKSSISEHTARERWRLQFGVIWLQCEMDEGGEETVIDVLMLLRTNVILSQEINTWKL